MSMHDKARIKSVARRVGVVLLVVLANMNASTTGGRVRLV